MDTQNFQPESDKSQFRKGIAVGILITLVLVVIAAGVLRVAGKKHVLPEKELQRIRQKVRMKVHRMLYPVMLCRKKQENLQTF